MNEIITKLNEIEEKAESIISDAKAGKETRLKQLEQDKKKIDDKYSRMEAAAVKKLEQELRLEADKQILRLQENGRMAISELHSGFEKNKEQLAMEIFQRIVQL